MLSKKKSNKLFCFCNGIIFIGMMLFFNNSLANYDYLVEPIDKFEKVTEHDMSFDIVPVYESEEDDSGFDIKTYTLDVLFTYGINDKMSVVFEAPYKYKYVQKKNEEILRRHSGLDDIGLYLTYKLYEKNNLAVSVVPKITIPNGDYEHGIGNGRATYGLSFLASKNWNKIGVNSVFEYTRNENQIDNELNIWRISLMPNYQFSDKFSVRAGVRLEEDTNKANPGKPLYLSAGFEYDFNDSISIAPAFEWGFHKLEKDKIGSLWLSWKMD